MGEHTSLGSDSRLPEPNDWACRCKCCEESAKYRDQAYRLAESRKKKLREKTSEYEGAARLFAHELHRLREEIAFLKAGGEKWQN